MSDLTEASIRGAVRSELAALQADMRRFDDALVRIDARLNELQSMYGDVRRALGDMIRVQDQLKNMPTLYQSVQQVHAAIDEIRARAQRVEESARYTAGYVAMRLKERYDSGSTD